MNRYPSSHPPPPLNVGVLFSNLHISPTLYIMVIVILPKCFAATNLLFGQPVKTNFPEMANCHLDFHSISAKAITYLIIIQH